jgi:hypothetical protein
VCVTAAAARCQLLLSDCSISPFQARCSRKVRRRRTERPTPPPPSSPSPAVYDGGAISRERTGFEAAASLLPLRRQEVVGVGRRCGLPLLSSDGAWASPPSSPRPADPSTAVGLGDVERRDSATSSGGADLALATEVPTEKSQNVDGTIGWVGVGPTRVHRVDRSAVGEKKVRFFWHKHSPNCDFFYFIVLPRYPLPKTCDGWVRREG